MSTADKPMYEWSALPWKTIQRRVFKLQKRIYQASQRGDAKTVHRLQKLLTKSWSARLLAVRRVTQDNRGKKTAGVDGVKSLAPKHRLSLAVGLRISPKARPLRRVWIPKPGKTEKRPLGIPAAEDKVVQSALKLVLEPLYEPLFRPSSHGFRPELGCHTALRALLLRGTPTWTIEGDIASFFDRIDHGVVLTLLRKRVADERLVELVRGFLKAGYLEEWRWHATWSGTPQGSVISPLLANVALHGLEAAVRAPYPQQLKGHQTWKPVLIRYADDFVVLHENLAVIEEVKQLISDWMASMGLELKPSKTRITHIFHSHDDNRGFDFLGWHVRQFPVGKTHSARRGNGRYATVRLGFKTLIRPSKDAQRRHYERICEIVDRHTAAPQAARIDHLNPMVRR